MLVAIKQFSTWTILGVPVKHLPLCNPPPGLGVVLVHRAVIGCGTLLLLQAVQCTVQSTLCTVYCALCTVYCALCTVHCALCTVHCILCTVHCALCTVQCTVQPGAIDIDRGRLWPWPSSCLARCCHNLQLYWRAATWHNPHCIGTCIIPSTCTKQHLNLYQHLHLHIYNLHISVCRCGLFEYVHIWIPFLDKYEYKYILFYQKWENMNMNKGIWTDIRK